MQIVRDVHETLMDLGFLQIKIVFLKNEECLLFLTLVADQAFPVVKILKVGKCTARTVKIFQDPRCGPAQERDPLEHSDLMLIEVFLIFLGPASLSISMVSS